MDKRTAAEANQVNFKGRYHESNIVDDTALKPLCMGSFIRMNLLGTPNKNDRAAEDVSM